MSNNLLTLEIDEDKVKFALARLEGKQIVVENLGMAENNVFFYENDLPRTIAEQARLIDELYNRLKLKEKNINLVLPDAYCFSQITTMPKLKEKELLSAIRYQADQFIPMPLSETALDLEIIHEDKNTGQILVMIVASPNSLIKRIGDLTEQLGLIPDVVENQTSVISRLISSVFVPTQKTGYSLVINFGYKATMLCLYSHDLNLIIDLHPIKLGYEIFLKEIQINLQSDYVKNKEILRDIGFGVEGSLNVADIIEPSFKEIVGEFEKYILYVKEKYKITQLNQVNLLNQVEFIQLFDKKIETALSLPVTVFDLKEHIKLSPLVTNYQNQLPLFISTIGGCIR